MQRRVPSTEKIRALTGWRATRTLDDILNETIAEAAAEHAADVAGST
jgi:UDP-glucose 4-epimerase